VEEVASPSSTKEATKVASPFSGKDGIALEEVASTSSTKVEAATEEVAGPSSTNEATKVASPCSDKDDTATEVTSTSTTKDETAIEEVASTSSTNDEAAVEEVASPSSTKEATKVASPCSDKDEIASEEVSSSSTNKEAATDQEIEVCSTSDEKDCKNQTEGSGFTEDTCADTAGKSIKTDFTAMSTGVSDGINQECLSPEKKVSGGENATQETLLNGDGDSATNELQSKSQTTSEGKEQMAKVVDISGGEDESISLEITESSNGLSTTKDNGSDSSVTTIQDPLGKCPAKKVEEQSNPDRLDLSPPTVEEEKAEENLNVLQVKVGKALQLMSNDMLGKSDQFVMIIFQDKKIRSQLVTNSLEPSWDFCSSLDVTGEETESIRFHVFDDDHGKVTPLGSCSISIKDALNDLGNTNLYSLDGSKSGKLSVTFEFNNDNIGEVADVGNEETPSEDSSIADQKNNCEACPSEDSMGEVEKCTEKTSFAAHQLKSFDSDSTVHFSTEVSQRRSSADEAKIVSSAGSTSESKGFIASMKGTIGGFFFKQEEKKEESKAEERVPREFMMQSGGDFVDSSWMTKKQPENLKDIPIMEEAEPTEFENDDTSSQVSLTPRETHPQSEKSSPDELDAEKNKCGEENEKRSCNLQKELDEIEIIISNLFGVLGDLSESVGCSKNIQEMRVELDIIRLSAAEIGNSATPETALADTVGALERAVLRARQCGADLQPCPVPGNTFDKLMEACQGIRNTDDCTSGETDCEKAEPESANAGEEAEEKGTDSNNAILSKEKTEGEANRDRLTGQTVLSQDSNPPSSSSSPLQSASFNPRYADKNKLLALYFLNIIWTIDYMIGIHING
jgi:hypothetical protein